MYKLQKPAVFVSAWDPGNLHIGTCCCCCFCQSLIWQRHNDIHSFPRSSAELQSYLSYRSPRSILQPGTQVTYISLNGVVDVVFTNPWYDRQWYSQFSRSPAELQTVPKLQKSAVCILAWYPGNLHIGKRCWVFFFFGQFLTYLKGL